jgi:pimeloyl-ACP methyl ester carboxylesterase
MFGEAPEHEAPKHMMTRTREAEGKMLKRVGLGLLFIAIAAILATTFLVWRYPLAVFAWANRRSLRNTGFVAAKFNTSVGGQTIFTKGNGAPLIFLHGAGDQSGTWVKVADMFTAKHRVILVDLAGHGESEPSGGIDAGPLSLGTVLDGLHGVVEHEAAGQKVTIVGNSLGAWMAMVYAAKHPERVERIVLVDGGAIRGERTDLVHLPTNREEAQKMIDTVLDEGSQHPPGFVLDDIARESQNGPMGRLSKAGVDDMSRYLLDGKLAEFATPVDLLWGESDRLIPMTYAKRLERELPAARLTTLARCGHIPQQECPGAFSKNLQTILDLPVPQRKAAEPPVEAVKRG